MGGFLGSKVSGRNGGYYIGKESESKADGEPISGCDDRLVPAFVELTWMVDASVVLGFLDGGYDYFRLLLVDCWSEGDGTWIVIRKRHLKW